MNWSWKSRILYCFLVVVYSFGVAYAFAELTTPKTLSHNSCQRLHFDPFEEFLPGPDENRTIRI